MGNIWFGAMGWPLLSDFRASAEAMGCLFALAAYRHQIHEPTHSYLSSIGIPISADCMPGLFLPMYMQNRFLRICVKSHRMTYPPLIRAEACARFC